MRKRSSEKELVNADIQWRIKQHREWKAKEQAKHQEEYERVGKEIKRWRETRCTGICTCITIEEAVWHHKAGIISETAKRYRSGWQFKRKWLAEEALDMAVRRYHKMGWDERDKPYGLYNWLRLNTFSCASYLIREKIREVKAEDNNWLDPHSDYWIDKLPTKELIRLRYGFIDLPDEPWVKQEINRIDQQRRRMRLKEAAKIKCLNQAS